jgi:mannosyltransferase OCH1-like enzyme
MLLHGKDISATCATTQLWDTSTNQRILHLDQEWWMIGVDKNWLHSQVSWSFMIFQIINS